MAAPRNDKSLFQPAQILASSSVELYAALVHSTADDLDKVVLPAGAKALRYAGINKQGLVAGKSPTSGDGVPVQKLGEVKALLAGKNGGTAKSVLPGDWAVIHNALGHVSPYVLGSGTAFLPGQFRDKYTNNEATAAVPTLIEQIPTLLVQAERIDGFIRTVTANNTRFLTRDGSEAAAEEALFTAPWDGTLRGFFSDIERAGGAAGGITLRVHTKPPGGAWGAAQINAADWQLVFALAADDRKEDTIGTDALASTLSLTVTKGTKVAIRAVKDAAVANVSQLAGRLIFF